MKETLAVPVTCSKEQAIALGKHLLIKQQTTHTMHYNSLLLYSMPGETKSFLSIDTQRLLTQSMQIWDSPDTDVGLVHYKRKVTCISVIAS